MMSASGNSSLTRSGAGWFIGNRAGWLLPALLILSRLVVGGIFLIAAIDKVQAPGVFADSVRSYHLLPSSLVLPFAYLVPWIELLAAVYLLVGFFTRLAAGVTAAMLLMFLFALGRALATGDTNHACGCFGDTAGANAVLAFLAGGDTITWWDLIRDLILLAMTGLLMVWGAGPLSVDGYLKRRREMLHDGEEEDLDPESQP